MHCIFFGKVSVGESWVNFQKYQDIKTVVMLGHNGFG